MSESVTNSIENLQIVDEQSNNTLKSKFHDSSYVVRNSRARRQIIVFEMDDNIYIKSFDEDVANTNEVEVDCASPVPSCTTYGRVLFDSALNTYEFLTLSIGVKDKKIMNKPWVCMTRNPMNRITYNGFNITILS